MSRKVAFTLVAAAAFLPTGARANPYMGGTAFSARQVPQTRHVQLTVTGCDAPGEVAAQRDGKAIKMTWSQSKAIRENRGSGVWAIDAVQACDCNVPVGKHEYRARFDACEFNSVEPPARGSDAAPIAHRAPQASAPGKQSTTIGDELTTRYRERNRGATLSLVVTSKKKAPAPLAKPKPEERVMPWDEPNPVEVQGLDCAKQCANEETAKSEAPRAAR